MVSSTLNSGARLFWCLATVCIAAATSTAFHHHPSSLRKPNAISTRRDLAWPRRRFFYRHGFPYEEDHAARSRTSTIDKQQAENSTDDDASPAPPITDLQSPLQKLPTLQMPQPPKVSMKMPSAFDWRGPKQLMQPDDDDDATATAAVSDLRASGDHGGEQESSTSDDESASSLLPGINRGMIRNLVVGQAAALVATLGTAHLLQLVTRRKSVIGFVGLDWAAAGMKTAFLASLTTVLQLGSIGKLLDPMLRSLVQGALVATPMIALGTLVERSSRRDASYVNFSTTNMVVTLFGRRRRQSPMPGGKQQLSFKTSRKASTLQVVLVSLWLATCTALSEEFVYRAVLPSLIWSLTKSLPAALFGQALLFGLGHMHSKSLKGENRVIMALQSLNGLWYGLAVLALTGASGGGGIAANTGSLRGLGANLVQLTRRLLPCIVAHLLYDMHVLVESWHSVNNQMDYTERSTPKPLPPDQEAEIMWIQEHESNHALSGPTLDLCRRFFYAFDSQHRGTLSLPDVQRAVSYAFLQDRVVPTQVQVKLMFVSMILSRRKETSAIAAPSDDPEAARLTLPEFLRLLFALRTQSYRSANGDAASGMAGVQLAP